MKRFSPLFFSKYEGAGNDFILIDDREEKFFSSPFFSEWVSHLCHRRFGIGADGVILFQEGEKEQFRMAIFNSNGTWANACGNGVRCFIRYLFDLGIKKETYLIAVGDRVVEGTLSDGQIGVQMGKANGLALHCLENVHFVDTGVPHVVQFLPEIKKFSLEEFALPLRDHPLFAPEGVNVNIAQLQSDGEIAVRTFERGIEGETWACGTGAIAVAAIASELFSMESPIVTAFEGGRLSIFFDKETQLAKMVGPAQKVFEGQICFSEEKLFCRFSSSFR